VAPLKNLENKKAQKLECPNELPRNNRSIRQRLRKKRKLLSAVYKLTWATAKPKMYTIKALKYRK
jgi:hypothetical protein